MRKTLATIFGALTSLLFVGSAQAADFVPWFAASRAGGYVDLWPAKDFTVSMFGAELQLRVAKKVFFDMTFTGAVADGAGDTRVAYGNPTFGAHYAGSASPRFSFFVGGMLTPPLLHDPASDVAAAAYATAQIRGYYDLDRLLPGYFAVRAMTGFEWNFVEPLYLRGELRPVVYIPTRDSFITLTNSRRNAELLIEHAVEFEGRLKNGVGFGLRFQGVLFPTTDSADQAQLLLEPFFAITPRDRGFYMRLGFPIALDEPLGFGLETNRLAGGRIALGGQF